jgi:hypothetical protein
MYRISIRVSSTTPLLYATRREAKALVARVPAAHSSIETTLIDTIALLQCLCDRRVPFIPQVTKTLQSAATVLQLQKLLIYCQQDLAQFHDVQSDIQTRIQARYATHVAPLAKELEDAAIDISALSVLADRLTQELGSTDALVCEAAEKLEAMTCHHNNNDEEEDDNGERINGRASTVSKQVWNVNEIICDLLNEHYN